MTNKPKTRKPIKTKEPKPIKTKEPKTKKKEKENVYGFPTCDSKLNYPPGYHFTFQNTKKEKNFSKPLQEEPCNHMNCTNMVTVGGPFCKKHLKSHLDYVISPSEHGLGLFTTKKRKKGEPLFVYIGDSLSKDEMNATYGVGSSFLAPYVVNTFVNGEISFIDSALNRHFSSFVNHSGTPNTRLGVGIKRKDGKFIFLNIDGDHHLETSRNNSMLVTFTAIEDIPTGGEILIDYFDDETYDPNIFTSSKHHTCFVPEQSKSLKPSSSPSSSSNQSPSSSSSSSSSNKKKPQDLEDDDDVVKSLLRLTADPLPIRTSDGLIKWQNDDPIGSKHNPIVLFGGRR